MRKLLSDLDFRHFGERQPSPKWQRLQGTETMIAGAGAGLVSSTLVCPLDVVKTKLQAQGRETGAKRYKGLVDTVTRIWAEEGIRGMYRGLGPTIFGYLPTWAIYFTVYDGVKSRLREAHLSDWISHITSAMTAGATGTIVTNPLWVIKTRFMTQQVNSSEERYRHTLDAVRQIYRSEGWHGFYRGLLPSLFGVTHVAVQFPLYERMKEVYRPPDGADLPSHTILYCSSVSKMVASVITYPHEVLRTRLQIQKTTSAQPSHSPTAVATKSPFPQRSSPLNAPDPPLQHPGQQQRRGMMTMSNGLMQSNGGQRHQRNEVEKITARFAQPCQPHHRIHLSTSQRPSHLPNVPPLQPALASPNTATNMTRYASSASSTAAKAADAPHPYEGAMATFKTILREEGLRGFYRGLGVNLLRTVPSSAVTILTYELIMRNLTFLTHQHPELEPRVD